MCNEKHDKRKIIADVKLIIVPLLKFVLINTSLALLIAILPIHNTQNIESNSPLAVLFILTVLSLLIVFPISFYKFQKKYAVLKKAPYKIISIGKYFLRIIQIYIIQYLILIALLIGIIIISSFISVISKKVSTILTPIITFGFIMFSIYWFLRLFFVPYILLFTRTNYVSGNIILESKYLIKNNIGFTLSVILFPIIISIPTFIGILKYHNVPQVNYFSVIIGLVIQIVIYVGCAYITINEVIKNSDFASEFVKNEES